MTQIYIWISALSSLSYFCGEILHFAVDFYNSLAPNSVSVSSMEKIHLTKQISILTRMSTSTAPFLLLKFIKWKLIEIQIAIICWTQWVHTFCCAELNKSTHIKCLLRLDSFKLVVVNWIFGVLKFRFLSKRSRGSNGCNFIQGFLHSKYKHGIYLNCAKMIIDGDVCIYYLGNFSQKVI